MPAFVFPVRISVLKIHEPAQGLLPVRRGDLSGVWNIQAYHLL